MFRMQNVSVVVSVVAVFVVGSSFGQKAIGQPADPPLVEWEHTYGNSGTQYWDVALDVQLTSDGGFIIAGLTTSFSEVGDEDALLVKTDSAGKLQWQFPYHIPGQNLELGFSVIETKDRGFAVVGRVDYFDEYNFDVYLVKTDRTGRLVWQRTFDTPRPLPETIYREEGRSLQQTSDGGYIIGGSIHRTSPWGDRYTRALLLKMNAMGNVVWTQEEPSSREFTGVARTDDGGYVAIGPASLVKFDSAGKRIWKKVWNDYWGKALQLTPDGGYVIVGTKPPSANRGTDLSILKINAAQEIEWQRTFGGVEYEEGRSIATLPSGGYVIGYTADQVISSSAYYDVGALKIDDRGNIDWYWQSVKGRFRSRCAVRPAGDGGYVVAGTVFIKNADCQLTKLTREGIPIAPSDVSVTCTDSGVVQLAWVDRSLSESSFVIERSIDAGEWKPLAEVPANTESYLDETVLPGMETCYRVFATSAVGISSRTPPACITLKPPAAPTNLTVTPAPSQSLKLEWIAGDDKATSFVVQRRASNFCAWEPLTEVSAATTTHLDTKLSWSDQIAYRVAAKNDVGPSTWVESSPVSHPAVPRWQLMLFRPIGVDDGMWVPLRPCDDRFQANRGTAVIVHGWNPPIIGGDQLDEWMLEIAKLISARFNGFVNVLAWDWLDEASRFLPPELQVELQASFLAIVLRTVLPAGYAGPVHFIGHSLGARIVTTGALVLGEQGVVPNVFPPAQVTQLDTPDRIGSGSLDQEVSSLRRKDVYVDSYHGIANLGAHRANLWVNVPGSLGWPFKCASGITGHSVDQWYRCTIHSDSPDADPVLYQGFCALEPLQNCQNCTIGFGISSLLGNLAHRPISPTCLEGTVKFGLQFPCPGVFEKRFIFLGEENCQVIEPSSVTVSKLGDGDYWVTEGWEPNFGTVNSTEMFFGTTSPGGGSGGEITPANMVARYMLPLDIQPEWDYLSFEYDFTEAKSPSTLEVTLIDGDTVYPVFQMSSDIVLNEGYHDTGLRDIRGLYGHQVILQFALRAEQPGTTIYLRNLTFWKDAWNGNHSPIAHAGSNQTVDAGATNAATVTFDGSATVDPDGDALTYWWMLDGELLAEGVSPIVELSPGTYQIVLVVRDPANNVGTDAVVVTVLPPPVLFRRADSNGDGRLDLADAVNTLSYLFLGSGKVTCQDATDVNDDGIVDLSDAIATLGFLFLGNPSAIKAPYPDRGLDPTLDELDCIAYRK